MSSKDPNHQDAFGNTALMIASNNGRIDDVRELLEVKADVNLKDKYGQTAYVCLCVWFGDELCYR